MRDFEHGILREGNEDRAQYIVSTNASPQKSASGWILFDCREWLAYITHRPGVAAAKIVPLTDRLECDAQQANAI